MTNVFTNLHAWLGNEGVKRALGKLDHSIIDREDTIPASPLRYKET